MPSTISNTNIILAKLKSRLYSFSPLLCPFVIVLHIAVFDVQPEISFTHETVVGPQWSFFGNIFLNRRYMATCSHFTVIMCPFKFHGSQSKYFSLLQLLSDPFFTSQAQIICKWNRPTIFDPFALSCQAGLKWFSIQVQFHRDLAFFCPHLALSTAEE